MKYFFIFVVSLFFVSCGGEAPDQETDVEPVDTVETSVDSLELYSEAVDQQPNSTVPLHARAAYFIRQGNVADAKNDLETAMLIDTTDLDVRSLYGDVLVANLELEKGKQQYEYVVSQDSINISALMGLGKVYALLDNSAQATRYLNMVLKEDPYYAEAYFMKGMIYRADFYKTGRQESWDRAMSSYQTAVEQDPEFYSAYVEMGVMHDEIGSDLALDYYESALDVYPESLEAWYNIGMFYQKRGKIDDALSSYKELNKIDSTYADAYYNQGYIHLIMTEELDSAVHYFDKAVFYDPQYFQAYNNLGLAYEKMDSLGHAKKNYQKAVEINPDFQLAKDNLNRLQ